MKDYEKVDGIATLRDWLLGSNYTVVLTGAGMSTESGIPDFRSSNGLWKRKDPMEVACVDALLYDYENFYQFYKARIENLMGCKPHRGYKILAQWESEGLINSIITQNVDGFHEMAGSTKVYNLHGTIHTIRCSQCSSPASLNSFLQKEYCKKCEGHLRPNVVLFGETLPQDELQIAIEEIERAELVIVIGTSLMVYPVSQLPFRANGRKVYINKEIPDHNLFDLNLKGMAGEILKEVDQIIEY